MYDKGEVRILAAVYLDGVLDAVFRSQVVCNAYVAFFRATIAVCVTTANSVHRG